MKIETEQVSTLFGEMQRRGCFSTARGPCRLPRSFMHIRESVQAFARLRNRPCLLVSGRKMTRELAFDVVDAVGTSKFDALDVVLQTGGGDIDAAFILARLLRVRSRHLSIFVPIGAKSAGTLVCLAADEVVMSDHAELGPLDAQIDGGSVLNSFKGFERAQVAPHLFSKVDMKELGEFDRMLQIGERYGETLLTRYRKIDAEQAHAMMERLVYGYPSHSYVLDRDELADIGLPVRAMDEQQLGTLLPLADAVLAADGNTISLVDPIADDLLLSTVLHTVVRPARSNGI